MLTLSGCATVAPIEGTVEAPESMATPVFGLGPEIIVAPNPNTQSEAVISVSADGMTVLSCFHGFFSSLSPGVVSHDGGATWDGVPLPMEGLVGGDCETALMEDGTWVFLASTVAGATVMVSEDNGTTWTTNQLAAIPTNGLADRPWIEVVGDELWLIYMPANVQPGTVGFTKSTDKGTSWSTPSHIGMPGPTTYNVHHGHFQVTADSVQIPIVRSATQQVTGRVVQIASTTDGGQTWELEQIYEGTQLVGDWPGLAITETGRRMVTVTGEGAMDRDLFALIEQNGTWSNPILLVDGDATRESWSFADGANGDNATFVVSGDSGRGGHVTVGRIDLKTLELTTWRMENSQSVEFASVDHDAAGRPFIAWTGVDEQFFVKGLWALDPTLDERQAMTRPVA